MAPHGFQLTPTSLPKYMSEEMALADPNFFCASTDECELVDSVSGRRGFLGKVFKYKSQQHFNRMDCALRNNRNNCRLAPKWVQVQVLIIFLSSFSN